jgi:hypothetical protein
LPIDELDGERTPSSARKIYEIVDKLARAIERSRNHRTYGRKVSKGSYTPLVSNADIQQEWFDCYARCIEGEFVLAIAL